MMILEFIVQEKKNTIKGDGVIFLLKGQPP